MSVFHNYITRKMSSIPPDTYFAVIGWIASMVVAIIILLFTTTLLLSVISLTVEAWFRADADYVAGGLLTLLIVITLFKSSLRYVAYTWRSPIWGYRVRRDTDASHS